MSEQENNKQDDNEQKEGAKDYKMSESFRKSSQDIFQTLTTMDDEELENAATLLRLFKLSSVFISVGQVGDNQYGTVGKGDQLKLVGMIEVQKSIMIRSTFGGDTMDEDKQI